MSADSWPKFDPAAVPGPEVFRDWAKGGESLTDDIRGIAKVHSVRSKTAAVIADSNFKLMVEEISFNHDSTAEKNAGRCALNLRAGKVGNGNDAGPIIAPEWSEGLEPMGVAWAVSEVLAADAKAAIMGNSADRGPVIHVKLILKLGPMVTNGKFWVGAKGGAVLGDIAEQPILFVNGKADVKVQLKEHSMGDVPGPGHLLRAVCNWQWQARATKAGAKIYSQKFHTIFEYCLVWAVPKDPWTQQPFADDNMELPWYALLRQICDAQIVPGGGTEELALARRMATFFRGSVPNRFGLRWPGNFNDSPLTTAPTPVSKFLDFSLSPDPLDAGIDYVLCDCTRIAPSFACIANAVGLGLSLFWITAKDPKNGLAALSEWKYLPVVPIGWDDPEVNMQGGKWSLEDQNQGVSDPATVGDKQKILANLGKNPVHVVACLGDPNGPLDAIRVFDTTFWQNTIANDAFDGVNFSKWVSGDSYGQPYYDPGKFCYAERFFPDPKVAMTFFRTLANHGGVE